MNLVPNNEQIKSLVGTIIATFGGLIAGWFAARGWFSVDQVLHFLNSEVVMGLIVSAIAAVWRLSKHTTGAAVAVVDAIAKEPASPVQGVVTTATPAGLALANSIPGMTTVPAGTIAAATLAKAA